MNEYKYDYETKDEYKTFNSEKEEMEFLEAEAKFFNERIQSKKLVMTGVSREQFLADGERHYQEMTNPFED
jgi:hypothetical protein